MFEPVTGTLIGTVLYCMPFKRDGTSRCNVETGDTAIVLITAGVLLLVNYLMPVITVIVCMVIQARILFLRSSEIQDPIDRRVAITILLVSTLLFTCHIAWIIGIAFWGSGPCTYTLGSAAQREDHVPLESTRESVWL